MKGRDRKALDPFCIHSLLHSRSTRIHLPSLCCHFIGISQHRLSAFSLACLPSSPPPLTHSPLHHRPKNVRQSSTKQFHRLQSCVPSSLMSPRLLFSLPHLQGPLTQNVKRSISITNPNADPVSFKIKTTAPKVRSSRVQIRLGLPVSQAVLRTAQLRQGRPRTDS